MKSQDSIIKSTAYKQEEILRSIMQLYCPDGFTLDVTYGNGNFYKKIKRPAFCSDIAEKNGCDLIADSRELPFRSSSIDSIVFDPPFLATTPHSQEDFEKEGHNIIIKRFGYLKSMTELYYYYYSSLLSFYDCLKNRGILVFKCQDSVSSGKQHLVHSVIINDAITVGFTPIDLFILIARNRIISPKHINQKHARKYHCYFIVFRK